MSQEHTTSDFVSPESHLRLVFGRDVCDLDGAFLGLEGDEAAAVDLGFARQRESPGLAAGRVR